MQSAASACHYHYPLEHTLTPLSSKSTTNDLEDHNDEAGNNAWPWLEGTVFGSPSVGHTSGKILELKNRTQSTIISTTSRAAVSEQNWLPTKLVAVAASSSDDSCNRH